MIELRTYIDETGRVPFSKWMSGLDTLAVRRIAVALGRLKDGNDGQRKSLGDGVHELRITFGPGYRIYLGREGQEVVILLWGGTKQRQGDDIARKATLESLQSRKAIMMGIASYAHPAL